MKSFNTRVYNVSDFVEWDSSDLLELSPHFQRRSVWSEKAKSYLIDTMIRGKPIPKLLLSQNLKRSRNVRIVVDGQQRLRAILEFISNQFKISKAHNKDFAGKTFSTLDKEIQNDFLKYEIGVDILFDSEYEDLLDIFARLNTYSVKLNKQELLNAQYLGYFKQSAYRLGFKYVRYLIDAGVLTTKQVTRMGEAELTSDILVAIIEGIQTNKNIEAYYKKYEDEQGDLEIAEKRYNNVMSYIGELYPPETLRNTNYTRIHLFYSLFCSIAHALYGIKNMKEVERPALTKHNIGTARIRLDEISVFYDEDVPPSKYVKFVDYSRRATTDTARRLYRSTFLCKEINNAIKK